MHIEDVGGTEDGGGATLTPASPPDPSGEAAEPLQPGLVGVEASDLERIHAEALHWEGEAARALEWLVYTRAALAEARARRDDLACGRVEPAEARGPALPALDLRIAELERTEAVQAAHAADAVPRAEQSAAALAEALAAELTGAASVEHLGDVSSARHRHRSPAGDPARHPKQRPMMDGMPRWGGGRVRGQLAAWIRSRRGRVAVASLAILGVVAAVWLVAVREPTSPRSHPPAGYHAPSARSSPAASTSGPSGSAPPATSSSDAAVVGRLVLSSIGVDIPVEAVGTDSQGAMAIPRNPGDAGWWQQGFPPGGNGHVVLDGHVHWENYAGPFAHLDRLRDGDVAMVTWQDGRRYTYSVTASATYPWNAHVPDLFGPAPQSTLVMITCSGTWDAAHQRYPDRLVVQATLVSSA